MELHRASVHPEQLVGPARTANRCAEVSELTQQELAISGALPFPLPTRAKEKRTLKGAPRISWRSACKFNCLLKRESFSASVFHARIRGEGIGP